MEADTAAESGASVEVGYNSVFERLVDAAEGDAATLVGLVAYGLYKIGKREWALSVRQASGHPPTREDLAAYAQAQTQTVLDSYRSKANEIVASYATAVLESERPNVLAEAIRGSFMRSFWPSFAASVAFAAILSLIVVIAAINGFGIPIEWPAHHRVAPPVQR
ncbi:hypothetical protein LQ948_13155 [Jiella sp. MQZ9-1]|uniref:Uncharacterized protein n=1 Tax=Jiella flava TaxID=2816857 RepID=A0A939FXZ6_9HYPH|nr:hypothetical protein [Jiella flava]MBO0663585.1 hypothetical protein [Jiella flava]MCD2472161.1 hypothetical protein [Jiella flava]